MLKIDKIEFPSPVFLAPMSGVTDAPFRTQVLSFGAPAVVTEMVAGEEYADDHEMFRRRAAPHTGAAPHIVQLVGRDPAWMRKAARLVSRDGADIIDINMGCPSRRVTGGQSGCALMREPDLARRLVAETIAGAEAPVTVKMRLGWSHDDLNASEIASIAQAEGARMITVHARTRDQFYKGAANWKQVRSVVEAVDVPVIVNGDILDTQSAKEALTASGAAGVMIGRGALGRPWLIAQVARELGGQSFRGPTIASMLVSLQSQLRDACSLYGAALGIRTFRKHLSATLDAFEEHAGHSITRERKLALCTSLDPAWLAHELETLIPSGLQAA